MEGDPMPKPDLENAYSLQTPEDAKRLYADWAETYDQSFAQAMDFALPQKVAKAFAAAGGAGPVLDFGCGTGLVGEELARLGVGPIDGADLSPEMLAVAERKDVYRDLIADNVLDGLTVRGGQYAGVVSSGTFTHGHVGPEALDELLRIAAPGAQFALSINGAHFDAAGFAATFNALGRRITGLDLPDIRFYGDKATGPHKDDTGKLALFRKA
jgi:predicted TPR repeat methyltransferase